MDKKREVGLEPSVLYKIGLEASVSLTKMISPEQKSAHWPIRSLILGPFENLV